jgi:hypothetical protein
MALNPHKIRTRFGRLDKTQRRELRVAIHDGASIGEVLLLVLVSFCSFEPSQVAAFLNLTLARTKELSKSVRRRIEGYTNARDHEREIESYADMKRSGRKGKINRQLFEGK